MSSLYSYHNILYYDDAPSSSIRLSFCRIPDLIIDKYYAAKTCD
jgi:hypothetical protein